MLQCLSLLCFHSHMISISSTLSNRMYCDTSKVVATQTLESLLQILAFMGFGVITRMISDLISNMQKNWPSLACPSSNMGEHGTSLESLISQHGYFDTALSLKGKTNSSKLLIVQSLVNIKNAIKGAIAYTPWIECNVDAYGNSQLYQIYLCVDTSGSDLIECPLFPKGKCGSEIDFLPFKKW
ncbi:extracellular ribonuclease le [Quercus suber]|uniref:Extracellular ribonuclease le n=1 Tax=Quercus suber TaxID=58331 RepID=A0AAW0JGT3_QUESU